MTAGLFSRFDTWLFSFTAVLCFAASRADGVYIRTREIESHALWADRLTIAFLIMLTVCGLYIAVINCRRSRIPFYLSPFFIGIMLWVLNYAGVDFGHTPVFWGFAGFYTIWWFIVLFAPLSGVFREGLNRRGTLKILLRLFFLPILLVLPLAPLFAAVNSDHSRISPKRLYKAEFKREDSDKYLLTIRRVNGFSPERKLSVSLRLNNTDMYTGGWKNESEFELHPPDNPCIRISRRPGQREWQTKEGEFHHEDRTKHLWGKITLPAGAELIADQTSEKYIHFKGKKTVFYAESMTFAGNNIENGIKRYLAGIKRPFKVQEHKKLFEYRNWWGQYLKIHVPENNVYLYAAIVLKDGTWIFLGDSDQSDLTFEKTVLPDILRGLKIDVTGRQPDVL